MLEFLRNLLAPSISLETQLADLRQCGIAAASPAIERALLAGIARSRVERAPYTHLLCVLGDAAEQASMAGPAGYPSDNIWHFDTECIAEHGDYVRIARRLASLSQGALAITDVDDVVDVERGIAWLSLRCGGQHYRWDAIVDDDWVDDKILSQMAALLERSGSARRYTYISLSGQDCLIGCATAGELALFNRTTGLKAQWLV